MTGNGRKPRIRADRMPARRTLAILSTASMALSGVIPALELYGEGLGVALVCGALATGFLAGYAFADMGTLGPAVVLGLVPSAVGELDSSVPRITALAGGVLVFAAAELG